MAVASAAVPWDRTFATGITKMFENNYPISFFTKPLDGYEFVFMAETLAEAGVDGLDLTVRHGGRVEPARVNDELPKIVETAKKHSLKTQMIVTSITSIDDPVTEKLLQTARGVGIKHYRLGYYDYDFGKGIISSLSTIRNEIERLAFLNKELGIQGGYQNHSGILFGAPVWDVWEVIKDLSVEEISCQFDIRHAVTEGASSWILGLHLLKKNIGSLAIKDFTWDISDRKAKVRSVPLGKGIVDFDRFFKTIKDLGIRAPLSLHIEYPLLTKEEEELPLLQKQRILVSKINHDVAFIHGYQTKYQLT